MNEYPGLLPLVYVAIEGSLDAFVGRPRWANPYSSQSARDEWEMWDLAWTEATFLLDLRGQAEASRWLRELAA